MTTHTHAHAHKLSNVLQCYRIRSLMKFVEMYTDHTQTFAEYVSLVGSINMSCFTVKTYHFVFSYLEDLESLHLWPFVARPLSDIKVKYLLTGVGVKIRPDVTYWELPFLFTISSSFFSLQTKKTMFSFPSLCFSMFMVVFFKRSQRI